MQESLFCLFSKNKVSDRFGPDAELYLFGSAARGDYEPLSDIDVLVLLSSPAITNLIEEEIFDLAYDIELRYGVVFGIIVYSRAFWNSPLGSCMPVLRTIKQEGIAL